MAEVVRKDLNDMVKGMVLKKIKTRYNERNVCEVTLFNGEVINFADTDGLYDLFVSYKKCGNFENLVKSRKLVEEEKGDTIIDGDDQDAKTYFCVLYELSTGRSFRLFLSRPYIDKLVLENYYALWKTKQKEQKSVSQAK